MGVTSSSSESTPYSGAPSSSFSVAGAGSGSRPWSARTKPRPTGSGEQTTRSMPRLSSASATPHTSPSASTAPTSWKCTRSGVVPWMRASACARRSKACCARAVTRSGKPAASICARIEAQRRCGCPGGAVHGDRRGRDPVPLGPARLDPQPVDAEPVEPVDRRAGVEQRAEQHVAGDAADAVDVEDHAAPAERRAIRAAIVPAPKPSSMFTTATPGGARGQHRQQRAHAAERGAVARARRHADHRRGHQAADHRGQRGVPAGDDDHAVGALQVGQRGREPVQPRHAGVPVHDHLGAEQLRTHLRLAHHRAVRRAAGDDRHQAGRRRHVARHPGEPRALVLLGVRRDRPQRRARRLVGAGDQHAARAALEQRVRDRLDLLRRSSPRP